MRSLLVLCSAAVWSTGLGQRCYSCTTLDGEAVLAEVEDASWRRWLENVRFVPRTADCGDAFRPSAALRAGARSQPCDNGVCMKMWFKEKSGRGQVWRSCIPNAQGSVREDCTRISSSQGDMEVCTCIGNLCNAAPTLPTANTALLLLSLVPLVFALRI